MHQAARERHTFSPPATACGSSATLTTPCARIRSQAASATSPNKAQIPNDQRQFCHCANGTATAAATIDDTDIVADTAPTTKPTRVGRLRLASAGSNTLPIAIAAPITIVPANNSTAEGSTERNIMPATSNTIEPTSTFSIPKRRASRAANGENSANASMGKAATSPINEPDTPKSSRIKPTTGPTATIGVRKLAASAIMANNKKPVEIRLRADESIIQP